MISNHIVSLLILLLLPLLLPQCAEALLMFQVKISEPADLTLSTTTQPRAIRLHLCFLFPEGTKASGVHDASANITLANESASDPAKLYNFRAKDTISDGIPRDIGTWTPATGRYEIDQRFVIEHPTATEADVYPAVKEFSVSIGTESGTMVPRSCGASVQFDKMELLPVQPSTYWSAAAANCVAQGGFITSWVKTNEQTAVTNFWASNANFWTGYTTIDPRGAGYSSGTYCARNDPDFVPWKCTDGSSGTPGYYNWVTSSDDCSSVTCSRVSPFTCNEGNMGPLCDWDSEGPGNELFSIRFASGGNLYDRRAELYNYPSACSTLTTYPATPAVIIMLVGSPTKTKSLTRSATRTVTFSESASPSASVSESATRSHTVSASLSASATLSLSATVTLSASATASASATLFSLSRTESGTKSLTESPTLSPTESSTATVSVSQSLSLSPTSTLSRSSSASTTHSLSGTGSRSASSSDTATPSGTASSTASVSTTASGTESRSSSSSLTESASGTASVSSSDTASLTGTDSSTASRTGSESSTASATTSQSESQSATASQTASASSSDTASSSSTASSTASESASVSATASQSSTASATESRSASASTSSSATQSETASRSASQSESQTATQSATDSVSESSSATQSSSESASVSQSATASSTASQSESQSSTASLTASQSASATETFTGVPTPSLSLSTTQTETQSASGSDSATASSSSTASSTASESASVSATASQSSTASATESRSASASTSASATQSETASRSASQSESQTATQSATDSVSESSSATQSSSDSASVSQSATASTTASQSKSQSSSASGTLSVSDSASMSTSKSQSDTASSTASESASVSSSSSATQSETQSSSDSLTQSTSQSLSASASTSVSTSASSSDSLTASQSATSSATDSASASTSRSSSESLTPSQSATTSETASATASESASASATVSASVSAASPTESKTHELTETAGPSETADISLSNTSSLGQTETLSRSQSESRSASRSSSATESSSHSDSGTQSLSGKTRSRGGAGSGTPTDSHSASLTQSESPSSSSSPSASSSETQSQSQSKSTSQSSTPSSSTSQTQSRGGGGAASSSHTDSASESLPASASQSRSESLSRGGGGAASSSHTESQSLSTPETLSPPETPSRSAAASATASHHPTESAFPTLSHELTRSRSASHSVSAESPTRSGGGAGGTISESLTVQLTPTDTIPVIRNQLRIPLVSAGFVAANFLLLALAAALPPLSTLMQSMAAASSLGCASYDMKASEFSRVLVPVKVPTDSPLSGLLGIILIFGGFMLCHLLALAIAFCVHRDYELAAHKVRFPTLSVTALLLALPGLSYQAGLLVAYDGAVGAEIGAGVVTLIVVVLLLAAVYFWGVRAAERVEDKRSDVLFEEREVMVLVSIYPGRMKKYLTQNLYDGPYARRWWGAFDVCRPEKIRRFNLMHPAFGALSCFLAGVSWNGPSACTGVAYFLFVLFILFAILVGVFRPHRRVGLNAAASIVLSLVSASIALANSGAIPPDVELMLLGVSLIWVFAITTLVTFIFENTRWLPFFVAIRDRKKIPKPEIEDIGDLEPAVNPLDHDLDFDFFDDDEESGDLPVIDGGEHGETPVPGPATQQPDEDAPASKTAEERAEAKREERKKELNHLLNAWKADFTLQNEREPTEDDMAADATAQGLFDEYKQVKAESAAYHAAAAAKQEEKHNLKKQLHKWRTDYLSEHGEEPTAEHMQTDPAIAAVYSRYNELHEQEKQNDKEEEKQLKERKKFLNAKLAKFRADFLARTGAEPTLEDIQADEEAAATYNEYQDVKAKQAEKASAAAPTTDAGEATTTANVDTMSTATAATTSAPTTASSGATDSELRDLTRQLNTWRKAFVSSNKRGPTEDDIKADAAIAGVFSKFNALKAEKQHQKEEHERKEISKDLNNWRKAFVEANQRQPTEDDIAADATIAATYKKYNELKAKKQKEQEAAHPSDEHNEERKKELGKKLNKWRAAFVSANKRDPTEDDIKADAAIAPVFAQYNKLKAQQQKPTDEEKRPADADKQQGAESAEEDEEQRKKTLSKQLNHWRKAFVNSNKREPTAEDIAADGSIGPVYDEYNRLKARKQQQPTGDEDTQQPSTTEADRKKDLNRQLNVWRKTFLSDNKRDPSTNDITSDPAIASVYHEYTALKGGATLAAAAAAAQGQQKKPSAAAVAAAADVDSLVDDKEQMEREKKEIGRKLNTWKKLFAQKQGRDPTMDDVAADKEMATLHKKYAALKAGKQYVADDTTATADTMSASGIGDRKQQLNKKLNAWRQGFNDRNGRMPTETDTNADPEIRETYNEYLQLKNIAASTNSNTMSSSAVGGGAAAASSTAATSAPVQRKQELNRLLNDWKRAFASKNGCAATVEDIEADEEMGPVYAEYMKIKMGSLANSVVAMATLTSAASKFKSGALERQRSSLGLSLINAASASGFTDTSDIKERVKMLNKQLNRYKSEFKAEHGRDATADDINDDKAILSVYNEYQRLKEQEKKAEMQQSAALAAQQSVSGLSEEAVKERKRQLNKQLNKWKQEFMDRNGYMPAAEDIQADEQMGKVYNEYLSLKGSVVQSSQASAPALQPADASSSVATALGGSMRLDMAAAAAASVSAAPQQQPISGMTYKQLRKELNDWRESFKAQKGRDATEDDIVKDDRASAVYKEYLAQKKAETSASAAAAASAAPASSAAGAAVAASPSPAGAAAAASAAASPSPASTIGKLSDADKTRRDAAKEKLHDRKKRLGQKLKEWKQEMEARLGREPTQVDIEGDPEMAALYQEYVAMQQQNKSMSETLERRKGATKEVDKFRKNWKKQFGVEPADEDMRADATARLLVNELENLDETLNSLTTTILSPAFDSPSPQRRPAAAVDSAAQQPRVDRHTEGGNAHAVGGGFGRHNNAVAVDDNSSTGGGGFAGVFGHNASRRPSGADADDETF